MGRTARYRSSGTRAGLIDDQEIDAGITADGVLAARQAHHPAAVFETKLGRRHPAAKRCLQPFPEAPHQAEQLPRLPMTRAQQQHQVPGLGKRLESAWSATTVDLPACRQQLSSKLPPGPCNTWACHGSGSRPSIRIRCSGSNRTSWGSGMCAPYECGLPDQAGACRPAGEFSGSQAIEATSPGAMWGEQNR